MRTAHPRALPRITARRMASGLTLLEMLVVFVLASLVGTLMIQGAGFFLGQYDNVKRIGREAASGALHQRWFASTVHAMVPYWAEDMHFVGAPASFQGITTQPLRARSGIPVAARWSIVPDRAVTAVVYAEQAAPCASFPPEWDTHAASAFGGPGGIACGAGSTADTLWTVLETPDPLTFQYAGLDLVWRDRWPIEGGREMLPRQVRLVTPDGQTVWNASFGLHPDPLVNPRDWR